MLLVTIVSINLVLRTSKLLFQGFTRFVTLFYSQNNLMSFTSFINYLKERGAICLRLDSSEKAELEHVRWVPW